MRTLLPLLALLVACGDNIHPAVPPDARVSHPQPDFPEVDPGAVAVDPVPADDASVPLPDADTCGDRDGDTDEHCQHDRCGDHH